MCFVSHTLNLLNLAENHTNKISQIENTEEYHTRAPAGCMRENNFELHHCSIGISIYIVELVDAR